MGAHPPILVYLLFFAAGFLLIQTVASAGRQATLRTRLANERLRRIDKSDNPNAVLSRMRKSRGLNEDGQLAGISERISELVLQSGLPLGTYGFYYASLGFALSLSTTAFLIKEHALWGMGGLAVGAVLPTMTVLFLVKRRRNKAVAQLPEALDIIIRSLGAGHPVPVAMGLVAREMADPIGSEFGIASDEVSFGSSVSAAIQRLSDRVGHDDFELFSAMIRLQERTGGNLAELLRSNASTIRDRQKMRLKIKAASAEGRMSAVILNAAPILLWLSINWMAPDFYGDIEDSAFMKKALWGVVLWMALGNVIMRRMINFKI